MKTRVLALILSALAAPLPMAAKPSTTTTTTTTALPTTTTTLPGGGVACPPSGKVSARFHYRGSGSGGDWSSSKDTNCANGSVVVGPQAKGDLKLNPGTTLETGYSFSLPGNAQPFSATVSNASVVFQLTCVSGAAPSPSTLTVPIATASYPVAGHEWVPTGDKNSPLGYQGSGTVPNACSGGKRRWNRWTSDPCVS